MFQIKYLEDKSVEKESNKGEKERKKWKDNVIFISWIRFMFPLDWFRVFHETHLGFLPFLPSDLSKIGFFQRFCKITYTKTLAKLMPLSLSLSLSLFYLGLLRLLCVFLKKGAVILSKKWEFTETYYRLPRISPQITFFSLSFRSQWIFVNNWVSNVYWIFN